MPRLGDIADSFAPCDRIQAAGEVFDYWSGNYGFRNPKYHGIVIDEFTCHNAPLFDASREAVKRIQAEPEFAGKSVVPYFYGICYGVALYLRKRNILIKL